MVRSSWCHMAIFGHHQPLFLLLPITL
jgi:hypothetical protein